MAQPFRLYNTLTRQTEDFQPIHPGKVGLYVCGMTVYADCHVGHARAMVVFDMVARYLRHRGWDVTFVRNYTDVDDKIITRAAEKGWEPQRLADHFIERFIEDTDNLGLIRPDHEPKVSQCIDDIQALIAKIVEHGNAYAADGSVWFDVKSFDEYGKLSGQKVEELQSSADASSGKRAPFDFALWKAAKPGEPTWDSPWGPGRPGWHIECSAMASKHLGVDVDIHGGGLDLVFPHHENEVAQSECGHAHAPYAKYWMHNGMLTVAKGSKVGSNKTKDDGDADAGAKKMGKSEGNAFNIREALGMFPAEAMRMFYLQAHYRSSLPWHDEALPNALALLARLYEAQEVAHEMGGEESVKQVAADLGKDAQRVVELAESFEKRFYAAMDDDFNTAQAVGYALELARAVNRMGNHKKAKKRAGPIAKKALAAFALLSDSLGLLTTTPADFQEQVKDKRLPTLGLTRDKVDGLLQERLDARAEKNWDRADAIRGELEEAGIMVMDRADGVAWRVRLVAADE